MWLLSLVACAPSMPEPARAVLRVEEVFPNELSACIWQPDQTPITCAVLSSPETGEAFNVFEYEELGEELLPLAVGQTWCILRGELA